MKYLFALALLVVAFSSPVFAAQADFFIKLDGIDGESKGSRSASVNGRLSLNTPTIGKQQRCVIEWEGKEYPVIIDADGQPAANTSSSTGRRTFEPLVFRKRIDKFFIVLSISGGYSADTKEQAIAKAKEVGRGGFLILEVVRQGSGFIFQRIE